MAAVSTIVSIAPSGAGQLCGLADWAVSEPRQDRARIVADGDVEPAACFNDQHDRCNSRARILAADVDSVLAIIGRNGAGPKRCAQCWRYEKMSLASSMKRSDQTPPPRLADVVIRASASSARIAA
jgi:hypothetical protein